MNSKKSSEAGLPIQPNETKALHLKAVYAIVQAAANVELFTIPLYMCSLYSVVGSHQITGENQLYRGRWWPGATAVPFPDQKMYADPNRLPINDTLFSVTNNDIFNKMLKVFIEEMLHLQLVGNLAKVLGVKELSFTSHKLMRSGTKAAPGSYKWHCYRGGSVIPHIVDLKHTKNYSHIKVQVGALNQNQIELFKAIESSEATSKTELVDHLDKYFPTVPFQKWTQKSTLKNLPMFGSIGHLYKCLWEYLNLQFADGSILLDYIAQQKSFNAPPQQDLFVKEVKDENGKPTGEILHQFLKINTTFAITQYDRAALLNEILGIINDITEQGEGGDVAAEIKHRLAPTEMLSTVAPKAQADYDVLKKIYKAYDDQGNLMPYSTQAEARASRPNVSLDHEELFQAVEELMKKEDFLTWDKWHENGNRWHEDYLQSNDYDNNIYKDKLPSAKAVADALNRVKESDPHGANFEKMTQVASGAIKGITTVLNDFWSTALATEGKTPRFPFPSMHGSGGRMSICWAVFGKCPDIAKVKLPLRDANKINHACQGISLDLENPMPSDTCADFALAHTCTGSNTCRAEGGCGFLKADADANTFNAPADNSCKGNGGCAVPISASQLFPKPKLVGATINLYDFEKTGKDFKSVKIGAMPYEEGDPVYDKAWEAYSKVMKHRNKTVGSQPITSDFRLVYPPST